MSDKAEKSVLRRKAGARRASQGLAEMTPPKAMRVALAKAGDKVLKVPVALREFKRASLSPDDLAGALPDPSLILRMEGAGGTVGLAVLCPQVIAAVIEAQTTGRVGTSPAPDRKATATDASLARGFVDLVIEGFAILAEECRGLPAVEGYRVTGRIADARVAAMALEDAAHLHLSVDLDVASGAKAGALHFILPTRQRKQLPGAEEGSWSAALEKAVMNSPARLEAILCKFRLPLSEVTRLTAGQVVPLTRANIDSLRMVATNGRKVMTVKLGRSGPMRAVRLSDEATAARKTAALPTRELGGLSMAAAGRGGKPAAPDPGLPEPAPMDDLPDPVPMDAAIPDLPDPAPLDDLPATLDTLPMAMDLDLPE